MTLNIIEQVLAKAADLAEARTFLVEAGVIPVERKVAEPVKVETLDSPRRITSVQFRSPAALRDEVASHRPVRYTRKGKNWTTYDQNKLRALWKATPATPGIRPGRVGVISTIMKRTPASIWQQAYKLGLTGRATA